MPVQLFSLLQMADPEVTPDKSKVHLACRNGTEHPLDVYLAGKFEDWQSQQAQQNFKRRMVVSLIQYRAVNRWLFVGVFQTDGCKQVGDSFWYNLSERKSCSKFRGRIVIDFARAFRNSYPNAETCDNALLVHQILAEPYTIQDFPGYRHVAISKATLDLIVRLQPDSWRTALSSVGGVYLISDERDGQLYVGSATGEGGIWQRWIAYSQTGHGGNLRLRELLKSEGVARSVGFRFSILEIADIHDSEAELLQRESHWKRILVSREHGLNAN